MHAGGRRKGKGRSRILYWFRTPPGVRVGRAALDEEAIRLIEEFNPEVEFDWTRILKGQGAETKPPAPRERDQHRRPDRAPAPRPPQAVVVEPLRPAPIVELDDSLPVDEQVLELAPERATHARLGSEGLLRLRARYAEVLARISERIQDPARQEELKTQAERLNPDTWVTDAEVDAGLEAYESVFEGLRSAIGGPTRRRRRKRRRGGGPPGQPSSGQATEPQTGTPEGEARAEDDESEDL